MFVGGLQVGAVMLHECDHGLLHDRMGLTPKIAYFD